MALYLIRHGETAENAARVLQLPEVPLSERGIAQARALATRLAAEGIARIVSSDLRRAAMTAEALQATTSAPIEHEVLLHERNFGALRGTPYAELAEDPFAPGYVPPEGESEVAFHARVERAWERVERLAAATEGHLAVVTHGLVCRAFVAHYLEGAPSGAAAAPSWVNTCLTIAEPGPPWRIRLLACTAHLEEDDTARVGAAV
jgi:probable phosphoglycerate mutase